jgi:hypothetical protein
LGSGEHLVEESALVVVVRPRRQHKHKHVPLTSELLSAAIVHAIAANGVRNALSDATADGAAFAPARAAF